MGILQLTSNNPRFSYVLRKNPENGMIMRKIRKGTAFGWFSDVTTYNVYFKDADNAASFSDTSFEYIDLTRYHSPSIISTIISEFFKSAQKEQYIDDIDEQYTQTAFINLIEIKSNAIQRITTNNSTFDYKCTWEHQGARSYRLIIQTTKSLFHLLNFVNFLTFLIALDNNDQVEVTDELVNKYVGQVNVIDPPFYIRYLLCHKLLKPNKLYTKYKGVLEKTNRYKTIGLDYGNTGQQRINYIDKKIGKDRSVVDIGCGEGPFMKKFANALKQKDFMYYAIDTDEEMLNKTRGIAQSRELDNVVCFQDFSTFVELVETNKPDVLLVEVIEHMSQSEARVLVKSVLDSLDFNQLIITTPDTSFNKHYPLSTEFRHHDHRYEFNATEFQEFIKEITKDRPFNIEFEGVGHSVDGVYTTQAVTIRRA